MSDPKDDPALRALLKKAQDPEEISLARVRELLAASFRVSVAGVDVTHIQSPALEPELQRAPAPAVEPAKKKRRRRK